MQNQKKNEKIVQKPGKFVPQEITVAPLDDITTQIESMLQTSTRDRMYQQMYAPVYEPPFRCSVDCPCMPCRRGDCGSCNINQYNAYTRRTI